MDNDDFSEVKGFTRYVTIERFDEEHSDNKADHEYIKSALFGVKGTNGMVKDIHELKMWVKFGGIVVTIISPLITAVLMYYLAGG